MRKKTHIKHDNFVTIYHVYAFLLFVVRDIFSWFCLFTKRHNLFFLLRLVRTIYVSHVF